VSTPLSARRRNPTVTWFELFYDLVVVAAIGLCNDVFVDDPSPLSALVAVITMMSLAWVWLLTTLTINAYPQWDGARRVLMVAQMALISVAGLSVSLEHGIQFATGHVAAAGVLLITAGLLYWSARRAREPALWGVIVPSLLAAAILIAAAINPIVAPRWYLLAAVLVSAVPVLTNQFRKWQQESRLRVEHLEERLGLFVIIVLGEGFVQLTAALHFLDSIPDGALYALMFVFAYALWWMYFGGTFSDNVDPGQVRWRLTLLGHLTLVVGIIGTLDLLVLFTAAQEPGRSELVSAFLVSLAVVLWSFALLEFAARGKVGPQGWIQLASGLVALLTALAVDLSWSIAAVVTAGTALVLVNAAVAVVIDRRQSQSRAATG
jgi:low temperature requirement protein LtrA